MARDAYIDGICTARNWVGPNGDGSLGNLSLDFIWEQAQEWGEYASDFMDGFYSTFPK